MAKFQLFRFGEGAPTILKCVECGAKVKKKEVILGTAKGIDDASCICATCIPRWEEAQKPERKTDLSTVAENEDFITYVHVATSDETVRETVYSIERLDSTERKRVIDNLVISLNGNNAPSELILFFEYLRDEAIARKVRELTSLSSKSKPKPS